MFCNVQLEGTNFILFSNFSALWTWSGNSKPTSWEAHILNKYMAVKKR